MIRSFSTLFSLSQFLRISTFYPTVHCFPYSNASDRPKAITSMDATINSPLEGIDRVTSLMNSTDCTSPDSECDHDDGGMDTAVDEFGGERMVVNEDEFRDPNEPNCPDTPVIERIVDPTNGTADHEFRVQFHLPPALRRFLTRKETHLQLMRELHTTIKIPHNKKSGNIVVTGRDETNVMATYQKIKELFTHSRKVLGPTHFVSVPMNAPNIRERFEVFKEQILKHYASDQENNIQDALFTSAAKLHLTFCVLTLASDSEHDIACRRLNECQEMVIEPLLKNRAITVRMRGIDIMNSDPTKAKILYAKVESTDDILQKLADEVEAFFMDNGSSKKDQNDRVRVKLHVTLMNSKFLHFKKKKSKKFKLRFDATDILKNFKEFDFGEVSLDTMHLSQMRSPSRDEYYVSSNIIQWT